MTYSFGLKTKMTLSNSVVETALIIKNGLTLSKLLKNSGYYGLWTNARYTSATIILIVSLCLQVSAILLDFILLNCIQDKKSRFCRFLNVLVLALSVITLILDQVVNGLMESAPATAA